MIDEMLIFFPGKFSSCFLSSYNVYNHLYETSLCVILGKSFKKQRIHYKVCQSRAVKLASGVNLIANCSLYHNIIIIDFRLITTSVATSGLWVSYLGALCLFSAQKSLVYVLQLACLALVFKCFLCQELFNMNKTIFPKQALCVSSDQFQLKH